jgi:mitochondrial translocator assembly and maintenance protein 41
LQVVKYGVIQRSDALRDLLDWDSLYFSGRLHKPVQTLQTCTTVAAAQEVNRRSAVAAALLLLPAYFSWGTLLHTICSLSYRGAHCRYTLPWNL